MKKKGIRLQQKILIFFIVIVSFFLGNFYALNSVLSTIRQLNAFKSIIADKSTRVYKMLRHANQIADGKEIEKNDLESEIRKFNQGLAYLKFGGGYTYGDVELELTPLPEQYIGLDAKVSNKWEEFQRNMILIAETPPFVDSTFTYYKVVDNYGISSLSNFIEVSKNITSYNRDFKKALNYVIGASSSFQSANQELLEAIMQNLSETHSKLTFISFLFIIIILLGLLIGNFFIISSTIRPLRQVTRVAEVISSGELGRKIKGEANDEVGLLIKSINSLIDSLMKISGFAENVGQGNFSYEFKARGNNDTLGKALIGMKQNLERNKKEDSIRNWANEGMNKFAVILRNQQDDFEQLSYQLISNLVQYLGANQGGMFVIEQDRDNDEYLKLVACYAYNKRKYLKKQIKVGQGIIGQCVLERKTTCLDGVPDGYTEITSGLGHGTPSSLLVVPIKLNDIVHGVLEIASFDDFEPYKIDFVEKLSENIASTLSTIKSNNKTVQLLEETRGYAERLRMKEEEMRHNVEELAATQEEMKRSQVEIATKENLMDSLINNTPEIIMGLSRNLRLTIYNKACEAVYGTKTIKVERG